MVGRSGDMLDDLLGFSTKIPRFRLIEHAAGTIVPPMLCGPRGPCPPPAEAVILSGMTSESYAALQSIRSEFAALVERWNRGNSYLERAQERLRKSLGYDDYRVETSVVYNRALDDIGPEDQIKVVLVADNPGKKEQLAENNRYLVGLSGKLAESWFRRELVLDFRREVAILNKTPIHTPKTAELRLLCGEAGRDRARLEALLRESQAAMADLAWRLYRALRDESRDEPRSGSSWPVLWISGVGELKKGGIFETYRDALAESLESAAEVERAGVWAFNHFSMNQFAIELKRKARPGAPVLEELGRIGRENARRVLGL
jgi:hypothetical protein